MHNFSEENVKLRGYSCVISWILVTILCNDFQGTRLCKLTIHLVATDGQEDILAWYLESRTQHGLQVRLVSVLAKAGYFPGTRHLHTKKHVGTGQARERKLRYLRKKQKNVHIVMVWAPFHKAANEAKHNQIILTRISLPSNYHVFVTKSWSKSFETKAITNAQGSNLKRVDTLLWNAL